MKRKRKTIHTSFEPETRFELDPLPAPQRGPVEIEIHRLKVRLLDKHLAAGEKKQAAPAVYQDAANEAAALAWLTPFPLLMLPVLLEEKVADARRRAAFQDQVHRRGRRSKTEVA